MTHKLLSLFVFLCCYAICNAQVFYHELSLGNFDQDFTLVEDYLTELNNEDDINIDIFIVQNYLLYLLSGQDESQPNLPAPKMCIEKNIGEQVYFKSEGGYNLYFYSHYKMNTLNIFSDLTTSTEYDLTVEGGIGLDLFTLYGKSESGQSNLSIIIIDKDLSFCESSTSNRRGHDSSEQHSKNSSLDSWPNPTFDQTNISFHLKQAQQVSLELIEPISGKVIVRKLDQQYLASGDYQYKFDLQSLPSGIYYFILTTEHSQQNSSVIKSK